MESNASERDAMWRQDLHALAVELPKQHKNLFAILKERDFREAIERLNGSVPSLNDDQIIVEMMKIVAMAKDSHTYLDFRAGKFHFGTYPVRFGFFKDGFYVTEAGLDHISLLGLKLVGVGSDKTDEAVEKLGGLSSHENDVKLRLDACRYLHTPEILYGTGVSNSRTECPFTFEDKAGNKATALMNYQGGSNELVQAIPATSRPLYTKNSSSDYWFSYIEPKNLVYFKYNHCFEDKNKPLSQFISEMLQCLDSHEDAGFVFDLRDNGGGSSALAEPLIAELGKRASIGALDRLFGIVGQNTESSAILNAVLLRQNTKMVFFGEKTAGKPNSFGEMRSFMLPNSGIKVFYSSKFFKVQKEDTDSFIPDVEISTSIGEYLSGKDPVLDAILKRA